MATYNSIHIDVNKAIGTAHEIAFQKDDLLACSKRIGALISSLKQQGWTGSNADRYCVLLEQQREKIDHLAAQAEKIADAIEKTARAYEKAEIAKLDADRDARIGNGQGKVPPYRGPYDEYKF